MSVKWIIAIVIVLGIVSISLNNRGTVPSFGIDSDRLFGIDTDERIGPGGDSVPETTQDGLADGFLELERGNAGARDYHDEYVIVKLSEKSATAVNITGWTLRSRVTRNRVSIGRGTERLETGIVFNSNDPIVLTPGDRAIIATPISPAGGSFKTNLCTGYFQNSRQFNPSLKRECPLLEDEDLLSFGIDFRDEIDPDDDEEDQLETGEACINHIERVSRCQRPTIKPAFNDACKDFLRAYGNYEGCVALHKNDPGFIGAEWRVFLSLSDNAWREDRETIELLDPGGAVIDSVSY